MRIEGTVVIITGASEGIGAACAKEFARCGARVSVTARSEAKLRAAAPEGALVTPGDVTQDAARRLVVERTLDRFGGVDILINNAGRGLYLPSWQTPMEEARGLMELNFFSALAMTQLVVPHMREKGRGTVVNVSSIAGKTPLPWLPLYSASKSALDALTAGLRMELKRDGIHTLLASPVYVQTGFQRNAGGGPPPERIARSGRFRVTAEECAASIRRAVERDARTVMSPRSGWLLVAAMRLFPAFMESRFAEINGTG